jgi:hypothetical protein
MSSVTKDPGVSSILLFSGSGINFPRPLYTEFSELCETEGELKKVSWEIIATCPDLGPDQNQTLGYMFLI